MAQYKIVGGNPLIGEVKVEGAKNAVLKMIAAAVLTEEEIVLQNVPRVSDVQSMLKIFQDLGGEYKEKDSTLILNGAKIHSYKLNEEITKKLRASIVFAGPLLARFGKVQMFHPGGCSIGPRPIDYHLKAFTQFGAKVKKYDKYYEISIDKPRGATIYFDDVTVTGTENALLFSVLAQGESSIRLAALEPEVQDLILLLNKMGAKIQFHSFGRYEVKGVRKLHSATHNILPDRIVGATFAIICAATNGHIQIKGFVPEHNDLFLFKLKEIGVTYQINKDILEIFPHRSLKPTKIVTRVFPGFPTDLQAPFSLLLLQAEGKSRIFETIFDSRLKYLLELKKMGGNIEIIDNHNAYIYGPSKLKGCEIRSLDLRAGATLVGAALMAEGESIIYNTELINRGYENFAQKLISLGANIKELS